jgi:tryptophanyl-tRNA synthetase
VKGLDGDAKMGKSLGNAIFLSDTAESISSKVLSAITDPAKIRLRDVGNPDICTVFEYHQLFSGNLEMIASECRAGTRGCVACKREIAQNVNAKLEPIREKRATLESNDVLEILFEGTKKARNAARETLELVKQHMHLDYFAKVA